MIDDDERMEILRRQGRRLAWLMAGAAIGMAVVLLVVVVAAVAVGLGAGSGPAPARSAPSGAPVPWARSRERACCSRRCWASCPGCGSSR